MDISKMPHKMQKLVDKAWECYPEGGNDKRGFADNLRQAVLIAPTPWAYGRYFCWDMYIRMLNVNTHFANESDKAAFKKILAMKNHGDGKKKKKKEEEPAIFRATAAFALGGTIFGMDANREENADYYRQVLEIIESIPEKEANRAIFVAPPADHKGNDFSLDSTVGKETKLLARLAKFNLQGLMDPIGARLDPEYMAHARNPICPTSFQHAVLSSDVTSIPPEILAQVPPELLRRLQMGGNACDCCGKTLEQLGVTRLLCCSVCKSAYYCGRDCQRKQWKAGHRGACRKPGEIKANDLMRIRGIKARPELNEMGAVALHVDPAKPDRWIVRTSTDGKTEETVSVAISNLFHARPAM